MTIDETLKTVPHVGRWFGVQGIYALGSYDLTSSESPYVAVHPYYAAKQFPEYVRRLEAFLALRDLSDQGATSFRITTDIINKNEEKWEELPMQTR